MLSSLTGFYRLSMCEVVHSRDKCSRDSFRRNQAVPSIGEPETGKQLQHDLSEDIQRPLSDVRRDKTDKQISTLCSGSLAANSILHFLAVTGILVFSIWLYI